MDRNLAYSPGPLSVLPFDQRLRQAGVRLTRVGIDTVQVNLGKLCNQGCRHCHVEAGPHRTEVMTRRTAELVITFVEASQARAVDLTGGAPELNPSFRWLVRQLVCKGWRVMDRCNLTVLSEPGQEDLAEFLATMRVEIVASLPCYTRENVDAQRGRGVYDKSIRSLLRLNDLGYGQPGSGLVLNLVYNPLGAFLPGPQGGLEVDYRRELQARFGITFNHLLTMANAPIGRFSRSLSQDRELEPYLHLLANSFNASTVGQMMCRRMISVSWDGYLYDCDYNQMLDLALKNGKPFRLGEQAVSDIARKVRHANIQVGTHCYACTAGAGSSCGGALAGG